MLHTGYTMKQSFILEFESLHTTTPVILPFPILKVLIKHLEGELNALKASGPIRLGEDGTLTALGNCVGRVKESNSCLWRRCLEDKPQSPSDISPSLFSITWHYF